MNLWLILFTGLTTGGLSCLAMQGGLLASVIANQKEDELEEATDEKVQEIRLARKHRHKIKYLRQLTPPQQNVLPSSFDQLDWLPVTLFLVAKLISHTILGFLLGWLGSQVELNLTMRLTFQGIAAAFMLATAANLLELHPIFRYVVFQPPKFLQRLVRNSTKSQALFTPAVLGFLTIFIPCGVTQAMEVVAITSGSAIVGAATMFVFVLGTSPLFAVVGVATAKLSETFRQRFLKVAAATLVILGLSSINGILVVLDSPLTLGRVAQPITYFFSEERFSGTGSTQAGLVNGAQQVVIDVKNNGYSPRQIQVKAGVPVQLTVRTNDVYSCASSFVLKAFNVQFQLGPTDSKTVAFTPTQAGKYAFTCSMGMYTGVLEVI